MIVASANGTEGARSGPLVSVSVSREPEYHARIGGRTSASDEPYWVAPIRCQRSDQARDWEDSRRRRQARPIQVGPQPAFVVPYGPVHIVGCSMGKTSRTMMLNCSIKNLWGCPI